MAGKPRAEYEISAKDETKKGVSSAGKGLKDLGKTASVAFKGAAVAGAAVVASVAAIAAGMSKLTKIYAVQEKAEVGLIAASKNNPFIDGSAVKGLLESASALQEISTYGDEAIIPFMQLGVNMGFTKTQIEDVSQAAIDLASSTGGSLDSAFKQIYKTLGGTGGELNETVAGMRDLTTEELKAGKGIELLKTQFGGMGEAMSQTTEGLNTQFKNMWGDVLESAGKSLAPLQRILLKNITPAFKSIGTFFDTYSEQITNFFLHFGDIATILFTHIRDSLAIAFSFENIKATAQALWTFLESSFANSMKMFLTIAKMVGKVLWEPLKIGFEYVLYGLKVAWQATMNGLAGGIQWLIDKPVNSISLAFETVVHNIGESIQWILNGLISMIDTIISALNTVIAGAHNATQVLAHPLDASKRTAAEPAIAKLGAMDIDWMNPKKHKKLTNNLMKFTADVGDIPVPDPDFEGTFDRIKSALKDGAGDASAIYAEQLAALQQLAPALTAPFIEGFTGFTQEFLDVINQELPPEAKNIVKEMIKDMEKNAGSNDKSWKSLFSRINSDFKDAGAGITKTFKSVGSGFAAVGKGIADTVMHPIETIGNTLSGIGDGLAGVGHKVLDGLENFAKNGLSEETTAKLKGGLEFAGSALLTFGKWILDNLLATEGIQELFTTLDDGISESFEGVAGSVMEGLAPLVESLVNIVAMITTSILPVLEMLGTVMGSLLPIFEMVGSFLESILVPVAAILADAISLVNDLLIQITPVIESILNAVVTMLIPVFVFLSGVIEALIPVFEFVGDLVETFIPIFEMLGELVSGILTPVLMGLTAIISAVLTPVLNVLGGVLKILVPIFGIIGEVVMSLMPIFNVLGSILLMVASLFEGILPIITILTPILEILGEGLSLLIPVIGFLALAIDAITRPIEFVADLFSWIGQGLVAFGKVVGYLVSFQFDKAGKVSGPGAFSSDAFTRPLGEMQSEFNIPDADIPGYESILGDTTSSATDSSTGNIGGNAASYGGNSITVNVVINAEAVVGDPGLREFALMIDDEIKSAQSLGIA